MPSTPDMPRSAPVARRRSILRPGRLPGAGLAALLAGLTLSPAHATDPILRAVDPTHHFPAAEAVEVPPGYGIVSLGGMGAQIVGKAESPGTSGAYGDTEAQTRSTLEQIQEQLGKLQLTMADIVTMHVYLKADARLGHADYAGMMRAYGAFFGTSAQPNLPTRSTVIVAGLVNPGWLVEIEVTAARPPHA